MVMKIASVAKLKARLSEFLAAVRRVDDVVITDRGRPVARLTGLGPGAGDARLAELIRAGTVRPPRRTGSRDSSAAAPLLEDPERRLLQALLQEREQGR